jgi:hypothetical protein
MDAILTVGNLVAGLALLAVQGVALLGAIVFFAWVYEKIEGR